MPIAQRSRWVRRSRQPSPAPDRAKRLECAQLAAALGCLTSTESAGKPDALQTLRDPRRLIDERKNSLAPRQRRPKWKQNAIAASSAVIGFGDVLGCMG
jgi:hypothetical protein